MGGIERGVYKVIFFFFFWKILVCAVGYFWIPKVVPCESFFLHHQVLWGDDALRWRRYEQSTNEGTTDTTTIRCTDIQLNEAIETARRKAHSLKRAHENEENCKIPHNRFCAGSGMWTHEKKGMFDPVEIDIVLAMKEKWGMKKTKTQYYKWTTCKKACRTKCFWSSVVYI